MFVCLCLGVTSQEVTTAVENGAWTSKQVATACGAGSDCGRCRRTVQAVIASMRDAHGGQAACGPPGMAR
ncbi:MULTISPECIES: bacterioferritin-associated ferredoxin [Mycobacteriaceae]|uniref:(2Fe-2S)-binding protein n=1 Tax=Mycobacteriaceae TaxID=1762 RepID=UPI000D381BFA|nr:MULTISPECIES: (2Fe-2S)-binding protein [Mycobacteriaceae]